VTYINVSEGLVGIEDTSYFREEMYGVYIPNEPELYIGSGESASMQWAVANLTCQEAQQNKSGYACVSNNSTCLGVNSTRSYIGYRCKCTSGFQGNPYILNGCEGSVSQTTLQNIYIYVLNIKNGLQLNKGKQQHHSGTYAGLKFMVEPFVFNNNTLMNNDIYPEHRPF